MHYLTYLSIWNFKVILLPPPPLPPHTQSLQKVFIKKIPLEFIKYFFRLFPKFRPNSKVGDIGGGLLAGPVYTEAWTQIRSQTCFLYLSLSHTQTQIPLFLLPIWKKKIPKFYRLIVSITFIVDGAVIDYERAKKSFP